MWCIGETINLMSIPHTPRNFDNFLTHFRILFKTTLGASETTCTKVCKLSPTSYVYFLQRTRAIKIIFDYELDKLIL